ncbi:MAG: ABC transporter ATP-binding protein [Solirubrobacterales bacterium]
MDSVIKINGLTKSYFKKNALNGTSLQVDKGKIMGLLGPNGSGKTTLLKIAAGLLKESSGEILIDGKAPGVYTKSVVSYLPDTNYLYKWMKIKDAVSFYKDFYKDFQIDKANELLDFMGLQEDLKVNSLSKGMLEKFNLTLSLSRKAKLYLLDEPLGGVDPTSREKIIDAILNNYSEDSSMIVTTHLVNDIERLFDEVAFISEGKIVLNGSAEDLRRDKGMSIDELYREVFK